MSEKQEKDAPPDRYVKIETHETFGGLFAGSIVTTTGGFTEIIEVEATTKDEAERLLYLALREARRHRPA